MLSTRHIILSWVVLGLSACTVPSSRGYDWDNYDVRDVQPNYDDSGYYQDNDSLYTPPETYGCSPQDIGSIGCE